MDPYSNTYPDDMREDLVLVMRELVGSRVRVSIVPDGVTRNTFGPQISVAGELEMKEDDSGEPHFRVLHDAENFTYFDLNNIVLANTLARIPTITLQIPVTAGSNAT